MNDLKPRGVSIDELRSDPGNARLHDERNVAAIARSLERFGQRRPLVCARGAGGALFVIAGNGTLEAARSLEWPSVLITEVPADWDADKARAYALADNRTAELAEWDEDRLADYLEAASDEDLEAMGWTPAERDYLLGLDITPDKLGSQVTNDSPQAVGATAPVIVGPYRFSVDRDAYEEWQQTLAAECGYSEEAIGAEIVRRIGL